MLKISRRAEGVSVQEGGKVAIVVALEIELSLIARKVTGVGELDEEEGQLYE